MTNFTKIPLIALSSDTKFLLSCLINPPKVIPSSDGIPRDWRGLADSFDIGGELIPSIANHSDPTERILDIVTRKDSEITINDLQIVLEKMERWDVIDDTKSLFEKDARDYQDRMEKSALPLDTLDNAIDNQMLTIDDLYRIRAGLTIQSYDAFLLCADEDFSFAEEMIQNLEHKHNLKLCVKDRDLISGATFEHEAVMQLISERCNRLLVVLSPNFLKSPANKFFLNFAQAIGIEKRQRKIIPCLYKKCTLPPQLMYTFILDYNKSGFYDFWGRLRDSIRSIDSEATRKITTSIQRISIADARHSVSIPSAPTKMELPEPANVTENLKKLSTHLNSDSEKGIIKHHNSSDIELVLDSDVPMLNLPSLNSLDNLESSSIDKKPTKGRKKTIMKTYAKKIKSFVIKS